MKCNEIRELISCMLDGELSAEDSAIVTEHLAGCPECMRAFEAFHAVSLAMEEMEDVPDGFTDAVMTRIHRSANQTQPKKRPMGIFRIAAMTAAAACAALVLMGGTKFASTHMYVGSSDNEAAEYVQLQRATPTPTAQIEDQIAFVSDTAVTVEAPDGEMPTTIGEPAVSDEDIKEKERLEVSPPVDATIVPMSNDIGLGEDTITGAPVPLPTATPVPNMDLLFVTDLLLVMEEAELDLFTEFPAYEVTVTAEDGTEVQLKIWLDGERIYCKDEAAGTAWYTFGIAEQLVTLLGEPAVTPTPAVTAEPIGEEAN